jgi:hypothetical protein
MSRIDFALYPTVFTAYLKYEACAKGQIWPKIKESADAQPQLFTLDGGICRDINPVVTALFFSLSQDLVYGLSKLISIYRFGNQD